MPITILVRQLGQFAISYFLTDIALKNIQAKVALRKIIMGLGFLVGSFLIGIVGIVFVIIGIFFALGDNNAMATPALWSAGISLLIAVLAAFEGLRQFKRLW